MTYTRALPRRYRARGRRGMGDIVDATLDTMGTSETKVCLDRANALVAPMDARINDLAKTWMPTGYYTSQDIRDIVGAAMKAVQQGQAVIDQARQDPNAPGAQDSLLRATDDLARAGSRAIDYLQSANEADAQGITTIEAQGLKKWVLDTMATGSSAIVTASVVGCIRPWFVGAFAAFQAYMDIAIGVARRVLGVALAVGETVLKVADDLPLFYDVLKWAAIIGGGYWLLIQLTNLKKSGRTVL